MPDCKRSSEAPRWRRERLQAELIGAELALAVDDGAEALRYAEQGYQLAKQLDGRASQADALMLVGAAWARLGLIEDAAASYRQALKYFHQLGLMHKMDKAEASLSLLEADLRLYQDLV